MRFWDSSAIVAVLVPEPRAKRLLSAVEDDVPMTVWWGTPVECGSALVRRERDGSLAPDQATAAFERLRRLEERWNEIAPTAELRDEARRLLSVHTLRAADAFQLAAALAAAEGSPATLPFLCFDERLLEAARREGFPVGP